MTDMEYTLDERVIRKPTHDTPEAEAVLAAAMRDLYGPDHDPKFWLDDAEFLLAAMPDWTLVPRVATADWTGSGKPADAVPDAEIARLRAAIQAVLDDAESQHPGGWGPDVTTVAILRTALAAAPSEP